MRILHLVHQYMPEHVGGTELYTQSLAQALQQRGHQNAIFFRGQPAEATEATVQLWATPPAPTPGRRFLDTLRAPAVLADLIQALEAFRPDLVHIQHLMGFPVAVARWLQERRIPYVITLHDYWWVCANAQLMTNYSEVICPGPRAFVNCARCVLARAGQERWWPAVPALAIGLSWRGAALQKVLSGAAALIAPSEFVRAWYGAHGVREAALTVIPHGITAPSARLETPREAGSPVRFAFIGGLAWQKGVHVLVEAFRGVTGAELWIAGDENFDPAYSQKLRALATHQVRFLGRLDRAAVWETLAQVDVVVVPSLWYETFALIVREAFAAGVPVMVSDLGALHEAVRADVDGVRVPPGDVTAWRAALQRLVDAPEELARLRANVRPPLSLEAHVAALEALYRQVSVRPKG